MKITRPKSKQPIPSQAKKVFQGEIFDVYQWPQKMYDGSIATFERLKRPDTAIIIPITAEGKILIIKEGQPGQRATTLGTVGGRIDEKEKPLQGAKRELLEETGYKAKEWILFDATQPITKVEWTVYCFIAKGCTKITEQNLDNGEKIKVLKVNLNTFIDIILKKDSRDTQLKIKLLEAKLDPKKMRAFKKLLGAK